jgi:membrane protein DedA with SNARE-associated domain
MLKHMSNLAALLVLPIAHHNHAADIERFLHHYGALALFVLVLLQDIGVPTGLPGTALVLIGGVLVYQHVVDLNVAALSIVLGAVLGASLLFTLARYGGRPLVLRVGRFVGLTDKGLDAAAAALDRVGPPLLLITRVAPGTRVYMTIFAGISGWTYRRFIVWTLLFCLLWAYGFVILGDILGPAAIRLGAVIGHYSFLLALVLIGIIAVYIGLRALLNHPRTRDTRVIVALRNGLVALHLNGLFSGENAAPAPPITATEGDPPVP